ncbi:hypothetical protein PBI_SCTP2_133 [Salicola phage SCTP-2]|nr:hypothetical protein PBI_SCTP2_133 [Salicola phage SCTP-2]
MRLNQINKPNYHYILKEDVTNFHEFLKQKVRAFKSMVQDGENKVEYEKKINEFMNSYMHCFLVLRTLIAYDQYASQKDSSRATMFGIGDIIKSKSVEDSCAALESFYKNTINSDSKIGQKLKANYDYFKRSIERLKEQSSNNGYPYYPVIDHIDEILNSEFDSFVNEFDEKHQDNVQLEMVENSNQAKNKISYIIETMDKAGYTELMESKDDVYNNEEDEYYMVVDMKLYDSHNNDKTSLNNFKNTLVARAKDYNEARKVLKSNAEKSLKELNRYLQRRNEKENRNLKVDFSRSDWYDYHTLYKGRDKIKKKNIKGLTGTDMVSTGVMYLRGLDNPGGNISSHPEYCPHKQAILSSNSSLSRYLNKNFLKKN